MSNLLKKCLRKRPHEFDKNSDISVFEKCSNDIPSTSKGNIIGHIPDCWNIGQYDQFKKNNDWLIVENKTLGCSTCRKVQCFFSTHRNKNIRLSKPWQECSVTENGKTRESQQSSLRKKIFEHKRSDAHKKAVELLEQSKLKTIEREIEQINQTDIENSERIFRTVYKIIKMQRPFHDLAVDIDLQILNGLPIDKILDSDKTCQDIAIHIAVEMKKAICKNIVDGNKKISILIEEIMTLKTTAALIVILKTYFSDKTYAFNLDLIELTNGTAENITSDILACLNKYGIVLDFLENCLIAFAYDGTSATIGKRSKVVRAFQTIFPNLIVWQGCNYRLQLAVNDCVNEVCGVNHLEMFIDKLYSLYQKSPLNQNELKKTAASLEEQIVKIGRILSVRWVASSKRTANAVLRNYQPLCNHFNTASKDCTRDTKERAKYSDLLKYMTDVNFVKNLNAMSDALDEMGDLSELLQRRNITLFEAEKAMETTIKVFNSMATRPGPKLNDALSANLENKYKGIQLHEGKVVPINTAQLYISLANNVKNRMFITASCHGTENKIEDANRYKDLLNSIKVLEPKNWPKSNDGEVEIQYGDKEVRNLSKQFSLNGAQVISGFRSYKMSGGTQEVPDDLKPLLNAIATIPISTSECERNFNCTNEIMASIKSSLSMEALAALLFIKCVGPPLERFIPEKYVQSWLAKGRHSADGSANRKKVHKVDKEYELLWKILE